jgi:hypothetical protein
MRILGILALAWAPTLMAAEAKVETLASGVKVIKGPSRDYYMGLKQKPAQYRGLGETHVTLEDCDNLPEEFDLRDLGVVGKIKDQGQCGSCWAFSETASLESAAAVATGKTGPILAEQELVSCDTANYGCDGGNLNSFSYQISHGQSLGKDYPYTSGESGASGSCKDGLKPAAQGSNFVNVGTTDATIPKVKDVQCALFKSHTIPWIVAAADGWMSPPTGDNDVYTSCGQGQVDHAIGLVGWKTIDGKVYFKVRNSWGSSWGSTAGRPGGEAGYIMMELGCDNLGQEVAYILDKSTVQCMPPIVKLPAEMTVNAGDAAFLSVKGENGADYAWFQGKSKVADGAQTSVVPTADTIYKVVAKNACGQSESQVRVKVLSY